MKLKEYQGKELFKKYGIPIPKAVLIRKPSEKINLKCKGYVVKAQVLFGHRQKLGLVKFPSKKNLKKTVSELLKKSKGVLVEEKHRMDKQLYLSLVINRAEKNISLIFSTKGGIDIEEIAKKHPKEVKKFPIDKLNSAKFEYKKQLLPIIKKMIKLMKDYDCMLVEINPLIISNKKFIALDSKVILDNNALYRHPEFKKEIKDPLEKQAFEKNVFFVRINGDISVIGNGAGLVMTTLDMIKKFGGKPDSFLDIGGGASLEQMNSALEICNKLKIKGILVNIFAGITRCDEIAKGLLKFKKKNKIKIPMVVRLIGTNEKIAKKLLEKEKISIFHELEPAITEIIKNVYSR